MKHLAWDQDYHENFISECGLENFVRMIRAERFADRAIVIEALMEKFDVDREEAEELEGEFLLTPNKVYCAYCKKTFETKDD